MIKVHQTELQRFIYLRLTFIFKKSGMTQQQLSWASGISEGRISEYLNGEKNPSIPTIEKLLRGLKIVACKFFRNNKFNRTPCNK